MTQIESYEVFFYAPAIFNGGGVCVEGGRGGGVGGGGEAHIISPSVPSRPSRT